MASPLIDAVVEVQGRKRTNKEVYRSGNTSSSD